MKKWIDYKEHVKKISVESGRDLSDIEEQARIISAVIKQRNENSSSGIIDINNFTIDD